MKVFNGKQAAEDYMSTHTLAFSTPELTLMRFSFWLGEMVPDPQDKEKAIPRLYTFVEEKDFEPVQIIDDDKYVPTGAVRVAGMYGNQEVETNSDVKFCSECGAKISSSARFCTDCGATQD
jgi:NADH pyrophosphatase NudC (nudix superfamily)